MENGRLTSLYGKESENIMLQCIQSNGKEEQKEFIVSRPGMDGYPKSSRRMEEEEERKKHIRNSRVLKEGDHRSHRRTSLKAGGE
jgi:hypothetical protein